MRRDKKVMNWFLNTVKMITLEKLDKTPPPTHTHTHTHASLRLCLKSNWRRKIKTNSPLLPWPTMPLPKPIHLHIRSTTSCMQRCQNLFSCNKILKCFFEMLNLRHKSLEHLVLLQYTLPCHTVKNIPLFLLNKFFININIARIANAVWCRF